MTEVKFFAPQTEFLSEREAAQELFDRVKRVIPDAGGSAKELCTIESIAFVSPKGHYNVKIARDFIRIQNKTYDYKVNFSDVTLLYALQKDETSSFFLMKLGVPLKKGKSLYDFVVMELSSTDEQKLVVPWHEG